MARLPDLADETLLQIASYLEPEPEAHAGPFYRWSRVLKAQIEEARSANKSTNSLSLACKRLHGLFTPTVYSYIPLTQVSTYGQPQLSQLLRSFETDESLEEHVEAAVAPGHDSLQFHSLFWLPNIHTLSIREFSSMHALEWEGRDHVGTSPVLTLRLTRCGAPEEALKDVLSWPRALEELWYEVEDGMWSAHYEGEEPVEFTSSAVERCLASQVGSLEKLVLSRPCAPHEGLGYSDGIDLRRYEKLRSLSINHVFLIGWDQDTNVWERLPKSLVELDVFYDDAGYINFVQGDAARPGWLFGLLEKKREFFPALERVRIVSFEWDGYDVEGEEEVQQEEGGENDGSEGGGRAWTPSTELTRAFVEADVSFSVFLHEDRRFKYVADGKGWEDNWEETLKVDTLATW